MRITPNIEKTLLALHKFKYLKPSHIHSLAWGKGSIKYAYKVLLELYEQEYVGRGPIPIVKSGNVPHYYYLGKEGAKHLREKGLDAKAARPIKLSYTAWEHLFFIADIIVAAHHLKEHGISLADFTHDLDIKGRLDAIPDAVLTFHSYATDGGIYAENVWLEADTGSEDTKKDFGEKIVAIARTLDGDYQTLFGEELPTIAFVTNASEKRRDTILEWIEYALEDSYETEKAGLFRVAYTNTLNPQELFLTDRWCIPSYNDTRNRVPLLERD